MTFQDSAFVVLPSGSVIDFASRRALEAKLSLPTGKPVDMDAVSDVISNLRRTMEGHESLENWIIMSKIQGKAEPTPVDAFTMGRLLGRFESKTGSKSFISSDRVESSHVTELQELMRNDQELYEKFKYICGDFGEAMMAGHIPDTEMEEEDDDEEDEFDL